MEINNNRWAILCRNVSDTVTHSSAIKLKHIRATKIKYAIDHKIANKKLKTRPLTTWLINFGIEQAITHKNSTVEIITNSIMKKGVYND